MIFTVSGGPALVKRTPPSPAQYGEENACGSLASIPVQRVASGLTSGGGATSGSRLAHEVLGGRPRSRSDSRESDGTGTGTGSGNAATSPSSGGAAGAAQAGGSAAGARGRAMSKESSSVAPHREGAGECFKTTGTYYRDYISREAFLCLTIRQLAPPTIFCSFLRAVQARRPKGQRRPLPSSHSRSLSRRRRH